jgi:5,10-methylene-tetrahydrofolate dehydrogenase/methenyl tetrahydrofolate cyclohydrolase
MINIGELAKRGGRPLFTPCTPLAVMELLKASGVDCMLRHMTWEGQLNEYTVDRGVIVGFSDLLDELQLG